jgi:hypothetical protein
MPFFSGHRVISSKRSVLLVYCRDGDIACNKSGRNSLKKLIKEGCVHAPMEISNPLAILHYMPAGLKIQGISFNVMLLKSTESFT